jgi:hypothetical protein
VTLHALTLPPVRIRARAALEPERGQPVDVALEGDHPWRDDCFEMMASGARLRAPSAPAMPDGRVRLVLATCAPRAERTPATIETNPIEIR